MGRTASGLGVIVAASVLAACSTLLGQSTLARTVVIQLKNYSYEPSSFAVELGETVDVVLRNETGLSHYFGGPELKQYFEYRTPTPNVEVPPHTSKTVRMKAIRAGEVSFTCFVPVHEKLGMMGTIVVGEPGDH